MMRKLEDVKLGAVQKRINLADLEKCCKASLTVATIGFDTAENGNSKVWVTGVPVHRCLPDR